MLVDYVRIYNFENQSVEVADPPEDGDSGSGGGGPSLITAVSVLIALAILFSMCMVSVVFFLLFFIFNECS